MEETELRARLESLAAHTAPPPRHVDDLTDAVVERDRAGRRRQYTLAAVAAAVVVALVAVPVARSALDRDSQPAAPSRSSAVYTTPTRGTLSDEPAFLDAMLRRPWTTTATDADVRVPPFDTRRVVFATERGGAKWVLVAGADPTALPPDDGVDPADLDELGSVAIAWFTGPINGLPEEMRVYGEPGIVDADEPTAVLSPTEPYGSSTVNDIIVVGSPGDRVELAWFRQITPKGEIFREFEPVDMVDGVAAVQSGQVDASIDRALRYRVLRGGTEFSGLPVTEPRPGFVPPDVDLARLRPAPPAAPGDAAVPSAIDTFISHLGVFANIVDGTVLWAGDLPAPPGGGTRVTVLAAQIYDWGVYLTGALGRNTGGEVDASSCGSEIRPSGTPLEERVVVLRCGTDSLVVVAPSAATTARALDDRGELIASYPLVGGVAVVPIPADLAVVEVLGADGETLDERAPMGDVDWGD